MSTLYRVEHPLTQQGPYRWHAGLHWYLNEHCPPGTETVLEEMRGTHAALNGHPPPDEDGIGEVTEDELHAFASLAQLREWFSDAELRTLDAARFEIVTVEVDDGYVCAGRRQVVFLGRKGNYVEYRPIREVISL
jgi:hypothetical protein